MFVQPSGLEETLAYADLLLGLPHAVIVQPGDAHWRVFRRLCVDADARGNVVPDAWFAALAIEAGCEWITLDRDYARFPGLKLHAPSV